MAQTTQITIQTQPKVKVYKIKNDIVIVRNHSNEKIDREWVIATVKDYIKDGASPIIYTTTEWYITKYDIEGITVLVIDIYEG